MFATDEERRANTIEMHRRLTTDADLQSSIRVEDIGPYGGFDLYFTTPFSRQVTMYDEYEGCDTLQTVMISGLAVSTLMSTYLPTDLEKTRCSITVIDDHGKWLDMCGVGFEYYRCFASFDTVDKFVDDVKRIAIMSTDQMVMDVDDAE
jgi:hypothetical protein